MGAKTLTEGLSLRIRPPLASLSARALCDLGIADIEKLENTEDKALISSSSGAKAGNSMSSMPSAFAWRGEAELILPLKPNMVVLPSSRSTNPTHVSPWSSIQDASIWHCHLPTSVS
ncbi:hypothetical protein F2Q70_00018131 [Brassica cretica]|uniref:Uncharacterized protein n=1 Tax=Brassica cretica TaxID=69181 RepID=A0A8S9I281_BRACR|nr:hypothetical protein F2Q70_00018131 [Brassica cretica]